MASHVATQSRPKIERDPKVTGLHIKHGATGSAWFLYYRTKDGQERRPKLGSTAIMNRTQARELASKILLEVRQGKDPKKEAEATKGHTMQELRDQYERLHSSIEQKASTKNGDDCYWRKHILPHFGKNTQVRSVTKAEVIKLKSKMRDTPIAFNRTKATLSKAMNLAEEWGWRDEQTNPCYRLKGYKENKRTRFPGPDEAPRLIATMRELEMENPWFVGMLLLLCLMGARQGEIMKSKRSWWHSNHLMLPDSKTGGKIIPISSHARAVLDRIPEVKGNPYLIVGRREGKHLVSPAKLWHQLCARAGIEGLRMHDLRRFFASVSISSGQTLEQTMQLMGHTQAQTAKRYAFLMTPEKLAAMQATGDRVMELVEKKPHLVR